MFSPKKLSTICPFRLNETYHTLYELQQKLDISDEYLMNVSKEISSSESMVEDSERLHCRLEKLLEASKETRDNLITWHLKETLVELNVTISLLTAKIKFIEYKLGQCEGLDLHQACSLSLVNFCNILSDMTVLNVDKADRKTMHKISNEVNIPIWLSHYRNQICHVPSESPCISILIPLVIKSLEYMRDSFWAKVLEQETFDARRCRELVGTISSFTELTSVNRHIELRKDLNLSKKKLKVVKLDIVKATKACASLRRFLLHNPDQVVDIISNFIVQYTPKDKNRNCGLLIEQVILARCFERFVFKLLSFAEETTEDENVMKWLQRVLTLVGLRSKENVKLSLKKINLNMSVKLRRLTEIPPLKCSYIAHKLTHLDHPMVRKCIVRLRHKLVPLLGKKRTILLIRLTKLAKDKDDDMDNEESF